MFIIVYTVCTTGFPKKDAHFPNLLSDDMERERQIIQNIDYSNFSNGATFIGNPVLFNEKL